jgi:hypothetical protein
MSTDQTSGQRAEQQPESADAAGCKSEMDRSVQGTDHRSGFAELLESFEKRKNEAVIGLLASKDSGRMHSYWSGMITAYSEVITSVRMAAHAKDAS